MSRSVQNTEVIKCCRRLFKYLDRDRLLLRSALFNQLLTMHWEKLMYTTYPTPVDVKESGIKLTVCR